MTQKTSFAQPRRDWARTPAILAVVYTLASYGVLFLDRRGIALFAGNERIIDTLGAAFLLVAACFCFATYRPATRRPPVSHAGREGYFFLALSLFFLLACGEELSWGQHLFQFSTPDAVKDLNMQKEFNIHNLWFLDSRLPSGERRTGLGFFLNSNRLFDYFMFAAYVAVPLAMRWIAWIRRAAQRLGGPVLPLAFAWPVAANYLTTAALKLRFGYNFMVGPVAEIRETNGEMLCALVAGYLYVAQRPRS